MDTKPKSKLAGLDKTKSFKAKKKIQKGTRGYGLK
jgi:MOB kinase activator 1